MGVEEGSCESAKGSDHQPEDAPEGHVVRMLLQQFADEEDDDGGQDGELVGQEIEDGADDVSFWIERRVL